MENLEMLEMDTRLSRTSGKMNPSQRRCWVLVLGDFGRSPRMQYHTESLLEKGTNVTVIAFSGSQPLTSIATHPNYTFAPVAQFSIWTRHLPWILVYFIKPIVQFLQLLLMMCWTLPSPDFILVQLPPAIPTLFICFLMKYLLRTELYFDWHNFAFTLMRLSPRIPRVIVFMSRVIEQWLGKIANGHFCVSRAMQTKLKRWQIDALVVYDRPHGRYAAIPLEVTHTLMEKLMPELSIPMHPEDFCGEFYAKAPSSMTIITQQSRRGIKWRPGRPAVVVSGTSWSSDEDFSLLLDALISYDSRRQTEVLSKGIHHPKLLVVITGRGPSRDTYVSRMKTLHLRHVAIRTLWLEVDDYPRLLASADLGVSLHVSSSGDDLPMKIVDMLGCALPVCSVDYPAIGELVKQNQNGELFLTAEDLCRLFWKVFNNFHETTRTESLQKMREYVLRHERLRWDENWDVFVWGCLHRS